MELQGSSVLELPDALLLAIMQQHMDLGTLLTARAVCSRFHQLAAQALLGVMIDEHAANSKSLLAVLDGSWRHHLFLAARRRAQSPATARAAVAAERLDYSSFCVPDGKTTTGAQVLVTDGLRLKMLDSRLGMLQGHIPPQFQHSPHRPFHEHIPCPVPVGSVPELQSLRLLLLQPVLHGARHYQQLHQTPHMYGLNSTWPMHPSACHGHDRLARLLRSQFLPEWSAPVLDLPKLQTPCTDAVGQEDSSLCTLNTSSSTAAATATDSGPVSSNAVAPSDMSVHGAAQSQQQDMSDGSGNGCTAAVSTPALALVVPRLSLWSAQGPDAQGAGSSSKPSRPGKKGSSLSPRSGQYQHETYDMQADLALQLLSRALALPCSVTYLDVSHHTGLQDNDLSLLLAKCSKQLEHLMAAGTQLGTLCLMMLGTHDRLNLRTLDLSYSCARAESAVQGSTRASSQIPSTKPTSHRHQPSPSLSNANSHVHLGNSTHGEGRLEQLIKGGHNLPAAQSTCTMSTSPPVSLVSGAAVMATGLRHRHPSVLHARAGVLSAGAAVTNSHQGAVAAAAGQQGQPHNAAAIQSESLYIRLLRSALGRLTNLTELRLAGNNVAGLFDPPTSLLPPSSVQDSELNHANTHKKSHAQDSEYNMVVIDSIPVANGRLVLVEQSSTSSLPATGFDDLCTQEAGPQQAAALQSGSHHQQRCVQGVGNGQQQPSEDSEPTATACNTAAGSNHATAGLEASVVACLSRLRVLDLSHATGLSAVNLHALLTMATNLEELHVHGCLSLAEHQPEGSPSDTRAARAVGLPRHSHSQSGSNSVTNNRSTQSHHEFAEDEQEHAASTLVGADLAQQQGTAHWQGTGVAPKQAQHCCRLRKLSVGWGCDGRLLRWICGAAQERLTSLHLGVGCNVTDVSLADIAVTCTALQCLHVQMGSISDTGVRAVLQHCNKLHHLVLEQCIGPFTCNMLPSCTSDSKQRHRWTLSTLVLCGPTVLLNDKQLRALIGSRTNTLHTLALTNCPLLTPATLTFVANTHGGSMQHLRLEQVGSGSCGGCSSSAGSSSHVGTAVVMSKGSTVPSLEQSQQMLQVESSSSDSAPILSNSSHAMPNTVPQMRPAAPAWRFREQDVLTALASCPQLQSLRLRHCCQLSSNFVSAVVDACPLLHHLTLDQCDLADKGLHITQSPYSPLQQVQVCRCKFVEPALAPQVPEVCSALVSAGATAARTPAVVMHGPPSLSGPGVTTCTTGMHDCMHRGIGKAGAASTGMEAVSCASTSMLHRLRRRVDSDVMVHDLLEGRTTVLHA